MRSSSPGPPPRIPGLSERGNGANPPKAPSPPATPTGSATRAPIRRWWRFLLFPALLLANFLFIQFVTPGQPQRVEVSYTFFKQQVEADNVAQISTRTDTIQGTFKQAVPYQPDQAVPAKTAADFSTVIPAFADPGLETLLAAHGGIINARPLDQPANPFITILLGFGPTLLLIGGFLWLSRKAAGQMGGGIFGMGKSQAKRYDQTTVGDRGVTFADVAGIEEAKAELVEIVDFLKDPAKYTRLGGVVPKGVLLIGAPGTGKTLLARAVAGEANVPFFSMGASEFVEMIVGVGASRVRDLFKQARDAAPAIIFIDELDAIGRARGAGVFSGSNSEQEQTLNQILTEMDGFSSRQGVIVLAATNRPDVLDQALLRPGRFDRRVTVQPPDRIGREMILQVHTRGMPLAADVDLKEIAASTPGLVGADLRNLANEAALLAARRNRVSVQQKDVLDALETLVLGPARALVMSVEERTRVAYHEGGHAILGLLLPGADPVNRVTIVPHGMALGVTYQRPEDDRHSYSEQYLHGRIVGAMGGRAAEEVVFETHTTGAENDMQQATDLARQMVTRWGMSERLGPVTLAPREGTSGGSLEGFGFGGSKPYGSATADAIDAEVQRLLEEAASEAKRLLQTHRRELDGLAAALLEHETLDEPAIRRATGLLVIPRLAPVPLRTAVASSNGR
jgi:cell division protease FtsH